MRQMLRQVLEALPDLRIAGEAVSAEAALEALRDDPRASPPVPSGSSGSGSDEGSPVGPRRVDLLLVDLSLPGMSGLELVKLLHDERPALRCLVVTGHGDPMYREAALAAGAVGFVTKDDPDAVLAAVRTALG